MLPQGMYGGAQGAGMSQDEINQQYWIQKIQAGMESCPAKSALAGVMGAGLGAMFGLFTSSMRYDTSLTAAGAEISKLPVAQQLRAGFKDMGRTAYSSGKNFGLIGAVYSGTECAIEGFRGKNDLANGVAAGCLTGGALAAKAGPQAVAFGCAGFAAFSAAIDAYMRMEETEHKKPVV